MTDEERAEASWDKEELWYKVNADQSSYMRGFYAGLKAGREDRIKEIAKEYPDFGKRVGYKMCMVDELETKKKHIAIGRRFGKTGLVYHTIVNSLPVSAEKKKKLHELYEKALKGEEND